MGIKSRITSLPWSSDGFRVAAECRPADELAGDFYLVTARGSGRLMVVIGDACGRGRDGAALLPGIVPRARQLAASSASPAHLLTELNRTAAAALPIDRFVTAAALELDRELCTLTVSNAGHVPGLARSAFSNVRVLGRVAGPPLGVVANATFTEEVFPFRDGDSVVLMTDGVLEAIESDLLGMDKLRALVAHAPAHARGLNHAILAALDRRLRGRRLDDVTLVTVEMTRAAHGRSTHLERAS
ncbi:MAG: serine/threonine-protein phosphatase [Myxococcales bacterium]|nr:serine/threonine-protein phosphatase [Myxococcales bacterium]